MSASTDVSDAHTQQLQALQEALRALLVPLARLSVARGLPFSTVDEMLKQAFVQAASDAHPGLLPHRKVSRISTVTGINRREVTRITQEAQPARPRGRSLVAELYLHWRSKAEYLDAAGQPRVLPRQGAAPSFETLAQEITRDVHPRSLLDEMVRLKLATLDINADTVTAAPDATQSGDVANLLRTLGANVGDHLSAAVENTLHGPQAHFEQALFAGGASSDTIEWLHRVVRHQWQAVRSAIVPELERRLIEDQQAPERGDLRLRVGLFSYDDRLRDPAAPRSARKDNP